MTGWSADPLGACALSSASFHMWWFGHQAISTALSIPPDTMDARYRVYHTRHASLWAAMEDGRNPCQRGNNFHWTHFFLVEHKTSIIIWCAIKYIILHKIPGFFSSQEAPQICMCYILMIMIVMSFPFGIFPLCFEFTKVGSRPLSLNSLNHLVGAGDQPLIL